MKQPWTKAGAEPALWDLLADPIVETLMRADRVTRADVLRASTRTDDRLDSDREPKLLTA